ncbi:hypothetical protein HZS_795, partial [Henneguya salminicola]
MQYIICELSSIRLEIESQLEKQVVVQNSPFLNTDRRPICESYVAGHCERDAYCPLRHMKVPKSMVCKHWLRGLCRKGDDCEAIHEYDQTRMPLCYYYGKFSHCSNKDCPFLHGDVDSKFKNCPWYDRGFCKSCKFKHVFRIVCMNYICGLCVEGPNCKNGHPKFEALVYDEPQAARSNVVCHACNEPGHKSTACPLVEMFKNKARVVIFYAD